MCPPAAGEEPGAIAPPPHRSPEAPNRAFAAGPRRRRTRLWLGGAIAVVVIGAGIAAFAFIRSGGTITATPPFIKPSQSTAPPRTPFAFQVTRATAISLGKRTARQQADEAAGAIAQTLSSFYDRAFADPTSWSNGVPDDVWSIFADTIRDKAKADASSFTPATQGVALSSLDVTNSTLSVQVLFDPAGRPQAAFAAVVFQATGDLKGGQQVNVDNTVTFYLQPISGHWVVVGYPSATTSVEAGIAGSASPGGSPGTSPTAGSSP